MTRSVIVTGGSGFVGRQAIPHLIARGFVVHILARSQSADRLERAGEQHRECVQHHSVDIHDSENVDQIVKSICPSHLLHLAWDMRHGVFWSSADNLDWIVSSKLLLNSFIEAGGKRVVAVGSCAEYDWATSDDFLCETASKMNPITLFGQSKLAARKSLLTVAKHHNVSAAWARLFFLFGPHEGCQRLVPSATRALLRGEPFEASVGDQLRDFAFVGDVAAALVRLLDSDVQGDINVASGEPRSVASILGTIGALTERPELLRLGAKPKVPNDPPRLVASIERLRREVSWDVPCSLNERLRQTVDWWRERG